ncbi:uncharacterized protein LOC130721175 isoform X2 [Lotus japonicus]|uniref:uncharacterized protein LOC130720995 isoform X2 n=1 Tax=Lotus japonicus TaxID=34305 RepID=UPI0025902445|nr:uncharacterized protein LOC130720995 isoform X2 [Lotus japonicus]XP_057427904.1 uncharacterized protein LOC130721175 isoform X2 [Lotus japonicus]
MKHYQNPMVSERRKEQVMMGWTWTWVPNQRQRLRRWKKTRVLFAAFLCCISFFLFTPKIPRSLNHHRFADLRNLLGVPNTLNVITNFPFLVVGVLGLVLALEGGVFNISSQAEVWAWVLFYAGILGYAFGSTYYHLKPDNNRVLWDMLPMMVAYSSLFSSLVVERIGKCIGLCCMCALLLSAFICVIYERLCDDIRLCLMFQFILPLAIAAVSLVYRSNYTDSRYWLSSIGIYLLGKFVAVVDRKLYRVNNYVISGHSLEHLCLALIPFLLGVMLIYREPKLQRLGDSKDRPRRGGEKN